MSKLYRAFLTAPRMVCLATFALTLVLGIIQIDGSSIGMIMGDGTIHTG